MASAAWDVTCSIAGLGADLALEQEVKKMSPRKLLFYGSPFFIMTVSPLPAPRDPVATQLDQALVQPQVFSVWVCLFSVQLPHAHP